MIAKRHEESRSKAEKAMYLLPDRLESYYTYVLACLFTDNNFDAEWMSAELIRRIGAGKLDLDINIMPWSYHTKYGAVYLQTASEKLAYAQPLAAAAAVAQGNPDAARAALRAANSAVGAVKPESERVHAVFEADLQRLSESKPHIAKGMRALMIEASSATSLGEAVEGSATP
jgi:hypothetical protein